MRLIDADAYAAEMKKRQDACKARIDNPTVNVFTDGEHWGGVFAAFVEAKLTLDDAPTIGGWISVKDRLPEPPAQCLVYSDKAHRPRGMETATYTNLGWMTAAYFPEITHWMPLPEPPEEETDEQV